MAAQTTCATETCTDKIVHNPDTNNTNIVWGDTSTNINSSTINYNYHNIAIGDGAKSGFQSIAIGRNSKVIPNNYLYYGQQNSIAIGNYTRIIGIKDYAGYYKQSNSIAIGNNSRINIDTYSGIAIGYSSRCYDSPYSIVIGSGGYNRDGAYANVNSGCCVVIGASAHAREGENGVVIGENSSVYKSINSIAIGRGARVRFSQNIVGDANCISLGPSAYTNRSPYSISIGATAYTNRVTESIAMGHLASVTSDTAHNNSIAIGSYASIHNVSNGLAIGKNAAVIADTEGFAITVPGNTIHDSSQALAPPDVDSYVVVLINGIRYKLWLTKF
jgi:hypothetical protein